MTNSRNVNVNVFGLSELFGDTLNNRILTLAGYTQEWLRRYTPKENPPEKLENLLRSENPLCRKAESILDGELWNALFGKIPNEAEELIAEMHNTKLSRDEHDEVINRLIKSLYLYRISLTNIARVCNIGVDLVRSKISNWVSAGEIAERDPLHKNEYIHLRSSDL